MSETNCGGSCDFVNFYSQFIATCSIIVVVVAFSAVAVFIFFVRSFFSSIQSSKWFYEYERRKQVMFIAKRPPSVVAQLIHK